MTRSENELRTQQGPIDLAMHWSVGWSDFSSEAAIHDSLGAYWIDREAVTHHSPGLKPWVTHANESPCLSAIVRECGTKEEKWAADGSVLGLVC